MQHVIGTIDTCSKMSLNKDTSTTRISNLGQDNSQIIIMINVEDCTDMRMFSFFPSKILTVRVTIYQFKYKNHM